ncbi:hypothetical protein [Streptomyces antibioticus]|uniref:hypothetical protein n=1 Tax=Streptomyces antibioticus TaxID=1890 RepID=UPI0036811A79
MNLIENPRTDPLWQGLVIAHESGCRWIAVPMLVNHRLVCVHDDDPHGCAAYGWCYRTTAEAAWERRRVLGEAPPPLNPCCLLAHTSSGQAHDARCTDEFRRITLHLPDHPWSSR